MRATTQSRTVFSRHYRFSAWVSLLALSFGPSMSAVAQDDPIPEGDEFVVGTADQGSFASFPRVGVHPAGNFIVVWEEFQVPGLPDQSRTGINAQIRDINGDPVGAQFQVNSTFEDDQRSPDIAIAPGGNFLVVWHGDDGDMAPDLGNIYAQRFGTNGQPVGDEIMVNSYTTGDQVFPRVASDSNGNFVIVWESDNSDDTDADDESIQGRRLSSTGVLGPQFQVNSYITRGQLEPAIAAAPDGTFIATWWSFRSPGTDGSSQSILARRLDSSATPVGSDFQINTFTTGAQQEPEISFEPDGDFLVVWQSAGTMDPNTSDDWEIHARRFNSAAVGQGDDFQVNQTYVDKQQHPDVEADPKGEFMVTWNSIGSYGSGSDESDWSVHFRRINTDGGFASAQTQINTYTQNGQEFPAVGFGDGCKILIAWGSEGWTGINGSVIVGQRFGSALFCDDFESGDLSRWSSAVGVVP